MTPTASRRTSRRRNGTARNPYPVASFYKQDAVSLLRASDDRKDGMELSTNTEQKESPKVAPKTQSHGHADEHGVWDGSGD